MFFFVEVCKSRPLGNDPRSYIDENNLSQRCDPGEVFNMERCGCVLGTAVKYGE